MSRRCFCGHWWALGRAGLLHLDASAFRALRSVQPPRRVIAECVSVVGVQFSRNCTLDLDSLCTLPPYWYQEGKCSDVLTIVVGTPLPWRGTTRQLCASSRDNQPTGFASSADNRHVVTMGTVAAVLVLSGKL